MSSRAGAGGPSKVPSGLKLPVLPREITQCLWQGPAQGPVSRHPPPNNSRDEQAGGGRLTDKLTQLCPHVCTYPLPEGTATDSTPVT